MFKFLHAADVHLDSPLRGLEQYEGAPVDALRGATRRALGNLVQLALEEQVDFVLIAGDVYDGNWPDHNTGLFFNAQMARLREANIPVCLISGNHDAENKMTRSLKLPENVRRFDARRPETLRLDGLDVAIHGQSFATAAVTDRLAVQYPAAIAGCFNIGLLHTSATGSHKEHEPYAPCSLDELQSKGYDYWALGHIHQRHDLLAEPLVSFPGNIQGRHIRETGPKGCLIVSVDARRRPTVRFEPLDVLRWERCTIDASEAEQPDDVLALFDARLRQLTDQAGDKLLAVRVELCGPSAAHEALAGRAEQWSNELRSRANDHGGGQVWIEKIKFETRPAADFDLPADGPLGDLLNLLMELSGDEAALLELAADLKPLDSKLPQELKAGREPAESLNLLDPAWLRDSLAHVQPLLLARLRNGAPA